MAHGNDQYTQEEREAAIELAATTSIRGAEAALGISRSSLHRWIRQNPELWSDLQTDPTKGRRKVAQRLDQLVERYGDVEHDYLDALEERPPPDDPKELAAVLKAVGSNRQAAVAGSRSINGDPEVHEHNINFPQIEQLMARMLEQAAQQAPAALPVRNEAEDDG